MADNPIDIVVSEKGVSQAADAVVRLADGADKAESSIGKLKAALSEINGSSVQALRAAMADAKGGTDALKASAASLSGSQKEAAASSEGVTRSLRTESAATKELRAAKLALALANHDAVIEDRQRTAQAVASAQAAKATAEAERASLQAELAAQAEVSVQMDAMFGKREKEIAQQLQLAQARELALAVHDAGIENARIDAEIAANEKLIKTQQAEAQALAALETQYSALAEYRGVNIEEMAAESGEIDVVASAYRQLAEATSELNATKQLQRDISAAVTDGYLTEEEASFANVAALQRQIEATEQVKLAKSNLAETIAYVNATTEVEIQTQTTAISIETARKASIQGLAGALGLYTAEQKAASLATAGGVSENIAASATLGLLEGRTLSVNRAAAQFLTKIVGIGPALTAAFAYIIGPIVLISVLVMIGTEIDKIMTKARELPNTIAESFRKSTDEIRTQVLSLTTEADKLQFQLDKINKRPEQNGGVIALDEMASAANRLSITLDKDISKLDELTKKNNVGFWDKLLGEKGTEDVDNIAETLQAKLKEVRDGYDNTIQAGEQRGDLTKQNLANLREQELGALVKVYADATAKLDPLIRKLQSQMADYNDPVMAAFGLGGEDPSADLAKAVGIQRQMLADQQQIGEEYRKDNLGAQVQQAKAAVAQQVDLAKEARLQWKSVLAAFTDYQVALRDANHGTNATTQDKLLFFQQEQPKLMDANKPKGEAEINKYQTQLANEQFPAEQLKKLQDEAAAMTLYGDKLRETAMMNKVLEEAQNHRATLTDEMKAADAAAIKIIVEGKPEQKEYQEVLKQSNEAIRQHTLYQAAGVQVAKDYPQYAGKIAELLAKESEEYANATDHLRVFNKGIADQRSLLSEYGDAQEVSLKLQQLQNQEIAAGHALSSQQLGDERIKLTNLQHEQEMHKDLAVLYGNEADTLSKLVIQQNALNAAHDEGKLNNQSYQSQTLQNASAQAAARDGINQGKGSDLLLNSLAKYASAFKDFTTSVTDLMTEMWDKIGSGAASAFSKWIVYGGNLGKAMKELAQTILQTILQALIQVVIQALITKAILFAIGLSGGGSAPATPSVDSVLGLSLLSHWQGGYIRGYANGGGVLPAYASGSVTGPGTGTSDSVLAWLSNGEYVMDAKSVQAIGTQNLDAIRAGAKAVGSNSPGIGSAGLSVGSKGGMKVAIEDHTAGVKWQTVQMSDNEVRVIARDEGKKAVYRHADDAVSQSMADGNSKTRRGLAQYTTARPSR